MFNQFSKIPIKKFATYAIANYHVKTEPMTFTPRAIVELKKIVGDPEKNAIKLNVKKKCCNSHSYQLQLVDKKDNAHIGEIVDIENIKIFINPKSLTHVLGTKMDFIEDDIVSEFVFNGIKNTKCKNDAIKFV